MSTKQIRLKIIALWRYHFEYSNRCISYYTSIPRYCNKVPQELARYAKMTKKLTLSLGRGHTFFSPSHSKL